MTCVHASSGTIPASEFSGVPLGTAVIPKSGPVPKKDKDAHVAWVREHLCPWPDGSEVSLMQYKVQGLERTRLLNIREKVHRARRKLVKQMEINDSRIGKAGGSCCVAVVVRRYWCVVYIYTY